MTSPAGRDPEHPLYGDPIVDDPDSLLMAYTAWLDRNGFLPVLPDARTLDDLVEEFMEARLDARRHG